MFLVIPFLLIFAEIFWQIFINYPPTIEQLNIGISNPVGLWVVRLISLIFIVTTVFFFSHHLSTKVKHYYWILVLACPALSLIWMSYPLDALKLLIISGVFYLLTRKRKNYIAAVGVSIIVISILNLGIFKQDANILNILSLKQPQEEVNFRFLVENGLNPNIAVPRTLRRLVYNKFFFAVKDTTNESLTFFDFETLFFQEVHPLGQKAFVIFFWPEIFISCFSIWLILTKKISSNRELVPLLILSFIYFMTTNTSTERRLILVLFPLAIIMANCINFSLKSRSREIKIGIITLIFLTSYGWATNYYDRYVRTSFWLDNRPIAYNFVVSYLKNHNEKYNQILVPDTLYALKDYCGYFLKNCPTFKSANFNLLDEPVQKNTLYIGFVGNFLGTNSDNFFPQNPDPEIDQKGLEVLQETHVLDNIANGYGQELIIARTQK